MEFSIFFVNISVCPPFLKRKHPEPIKVFNGLVKIRFNIQGESLVIFDYILVNSTLLLVDYEIISTDTKRHDCVKYSGVRNGVLSISHIPIVYIFSARNNPLQRLTNWSYTQFLLYHK